MTKMYVYEDGEVIGEVKLDTKNLKREEVKKVFLKFFDVDIDDPEEFELDVEKSPDGEVYIAVGEDMYLWSEDNR